MLSLLIAGTLLRSPEQKISAAGKTYVVGLMRAPIDGAGVVHVELVAFEHRATSALIALSRGDAVAVTGRGKLMSWMAHSGETRHGLSVTVDQVLTLYAIDKRRRQTTKGETLSTARDEAPP